MVLFELDSPTSREIPSVHSTGLVLLLSKCSDSEDDFSIFSVDSTLHRNLKLQKGSRVFKLGVSSKQDGRGKKQYSAAQTRRHQ